MQPQANRSEGTAWKYLASPPEPNAWSRNKTFGIDLSSDFVWIDDAPLGFEIDALRSRDLLDRLIVIDTNKDNVGLLRAIDAINSLSKRSKSHDTNTNTNT